MTETEKEIEQKKKELQELEKKLSNEKLHSYIASLNIHDGDYISCNDSLGYTYYFRYFENLTKFEEVKPHASEGFYFSDNVNIIKMTVQTKGLIKPFCITLNFVQAVYPVVIDFLSKLEINAKVKIITKEEYEQVVDMAISQLEDLKK